MCKRLRVRFMFHVCFQFPKLLDVLPLTYDTDCCFVFKYPQVSKEGDDFRVPISVAKMSELVKSMMDGKRHSCYCLYRTPT